MSTGGEVEVERVGFVDRRPSESTIHRNIGTADNLNAGDGTTALAFIDGECEGLGGLGLDAEGIVVERGGGLARDALAPSGSVAVGRSRRRLSLDIAQRLYHFLRRVVGAVDFYGRERPGGGSRGEVDDDVVHLVRNVRDGDCGRGVRASPDASHEQGIDVGTVRAPQANARPLDGNPCGTRERLLAVGPRQVDPRRTRHGDDTIGCRSVRDSRLREKARTIGRRGVCAEVQIDGGGLRGLFRGSTPP